MFGDSYAFMWLPALDEIGKRLQWKIVMIVKSGCRPVYAEVYNEQTKAPFLECSRWHDYAVARINAAHPDLVVLNNAAENNSRGVPFSPTEWANALQKMLGAISIPNGRKVILGQMVRVRPREWTADWPGLSGKPTRWTSRHAPLRIVLAWTEVFYIKRPNRSL